MSYRIKFLRAVSSKYLLRKAPVYKSWCQFKSSYYYSKEYLSYLPFYRLWIRRNTFTVFKSIKLIRSIHTTERKQALGPLLAVVLRPILKLSAMLFGRSLRKWWERLSPREREIIMDKVKARTTLLAACGTAFSGSVFLYYVEHIAEEPITKRRRFIIYTEEQMQMIAQMEFENQLTTYSKDIIPTNHNLYRRVAKVAMQLIQANNDLPAMRNKNWTVTVVDRADITNAFVLPNGNIFVFTGMLNVCSNDDQLAMVLAHEMSHAILQHNAENLSKVLFVETLLLVPLVVFWATMPDLTALFTQWLSSELAQIMIHLPFSRFIEREADIIGLQLAARSCFDVREAPVFWAKMKEVSSYDHKNVSPVEFLSTHPSHESRQQDLAAVLPIALRMRDASSCPSLPPSSYAQRKSLHPN